MPVSIWGAQQQPDAHWEFLEHKAISRVEGKSNGSAAGSIWSWVQHRFFCSTGLWGEKKPLFCMFSCSRSVLRTELVSVTLVSIFTSSSPTAKLLPQSWSGFQLLCISSAPGTHVVALPLPFATSWIQMSAWSPGRKTLFVTGYATVWLDFQKTSIFQDVFHWSCFHGRSEYIIQWHKSCFLNKTSSFWRL